jgi:hypothetical protein
MKVRSVVVACAAVAAAAVAIPAGASADSGTVTALCGVGGQAQPPPCDAEWYTSPVSVVWNIVGTPSQTPSGCQDDVYNTDQVTPLACSVVWLGGTTTTVSFPLHVEISTPTTTATPDRPPDANGWYNHPVTVTLAGTAFSGIAACTPAQTYAGPSSGSTSLAGSCTDNAGKTAAASFPFRYDATPPSLAVAAQPADGVAGLSWHAAAGPAPLAWVRVARRPGLEKAASSVLYTGSETSYQDRDVRNGTTYTYTITAADQAGNLTQHTVKLKPGIRLLAPSPKARLKAPPTLRWTAIGQASYYNVQLFRGSKILSAWPTKPSFRLARSWRFGGKRQRLAPGRYHWYVWPGYGPQRAARYGKVIGNATFVIR